MTDDLWKISLWHGHAQMVRNGAFSHKIDYLTIFKDILNLEGHKNCIAGSRVNAILRNRYLKKYIYICV